MTLEPNCSPALVLGGLNLKNVLPPWHLEVVHSAHWNQPQPHLCFLNLSFQEILLSGRANAHLCLGERMCTPVTHATAVQDTYAEAQFLCVSAPVSLNMASLQLPVVQIRAAVKRILAAKSLTIEEIRTGKPGKPLLLTWLSIHQHNFKSSPLRLSPLNKL